MVTCLDESMSSAVPNVRCVNAPLDVTCAGLCQSRKKIFELNL